MTVKIPRSITPGQRRATLLFSDCIRRTSGCRMEFQGSARVSLSGLRWEDRQRMAYRHWNRVRLLRSDRTVAVCGNDRCLDKAHLRIVPAPTPPKLPKPPRASRARAPAAPVITPGPTPAA